MATKSSDPNLEFDNPLSSQSTPLLALPLEIRTLIYRYISPIEKVIHPNVGTLFTAAKNHENGAKFHRHEKVLGLARTCQAFYIDFLPIYYTSNTLSFCSAYDAYRYLYMMGPFRRSCVRKIDVWLIAGIENWWSYKTKEVYEWLAESLKECRNLKQLGIGVGPETTKGMKGPVEGLEGLKGMGVTGCTLRVEEVDEWGPYLLGFFEEDRNDGRERCFGPRRFPYFKQEQLYGLAKRLGELMKSTEVQVDECHDSDSDKEELSKEAEAKIEPEQLHKSRRSKRGRKPRSQRVHAL